MYPQHLIPSEIEENPFDNPGCEIVNVNIRFLTIGTCFFAETI
jgi:hypothetical protein